MQSIPEGAKEDAAPNSDEENMEDNSGLVEGEECEGKMTHDEDYAPQELNDALYAVSDAFRVAKPSVWFTWSCVALESGTLFLWPFVAILRLGNYLIAIQFFFLMVFSLFRNYFNPAIALQEVGSINASTRSATPWRNASRFSSILDEVTANRSRYVWMTMLVFSLLIFLVAGFLAIQGGITSTDTSTKQEPASAFLRQGFINDFEYVADAELTYPTCLIGKNFLPGINETRLVDYTFGSLLAYKDESIVQEELDLWFGEGVVTDMQHFVDAYRDGTGSRGKAVSYKLFNITNGLLVVSIRGTFGPYDLLADAQLWSTAFLMQLLRFLLPLGNMWTPIFDDLVFAISSGLQSTTVKNIAFYRETTEFVKYLQDSGLSEGKGIALTGHSLGGGLAIITGTQTKEPAVVISGPNARLSRRTFIPQLSIEDLNLYSLNVIPERDPVAHVDDVARLSQNIRCTAAENELFACHAIERTFCELMIGLWESRTACHLHVRQGIWISRAITDWQSNVSGGVWMKLSSKLVVLPACCSSSRGTLRKGSLRRS